MHLLSTQPGRFVEDESVVTRLDQTPGEIVVISSADSTLSLLAAARGRLQEEGVAYPELRLANLMHLRQPASLDLYVDEVLRHAKVLVIDHLGGASAWRYGLEQIEQLARKKGLKLAVFSGDQKEDPDLLARSTLAQPVCRLLWQYLRAGGGANARQFLRALAYQGLGQGDAPEPPRVLPPLMLHVPGTPLALLGDTAVAGIDQLRARWKPGLPMVALLFYRSHLQSGNTAAFDAIAATLEAEGMNVLPLAVYSLKESLCLDGLRRLCAEHAVQLVLNTTAFAALGMDSGEGGTQPMQELAGDAPVFQLVVSGGNREDWLADSQGLRPRDIAMQIALPEMDGRIITRAVSF
ncbi:MAG: cobaltochelatase subunit CobN, partial [Comamonadaceae bacterium]